jgi:cephalosporin hydroxylase
MKTYSPTKHSLNLVEEISQTMDGKTFHHHYHILWDIRNSIEKETVNYVEIGTHCGGSASLMMKSPKITNVFGIDDATSSDSSIVYNNIEKYKLKHNTFQYLIGDSRDKKIIELVSKIENGIDILFIDGGHSYQNVIDDFLNYKDFINSGGYVIFDDYHDVEFCPQVMHGVHFILEELLFDEYDILGYHKNVLGAYPKELKNNNEFVIRKK